MKINRINIFTTIFALVILTGTIFAIDDKYEPGETLNPACTPGESNCTVKYKGKFVDGSDINDAVYVVGNVGIGTTSPDSKLEINASNPILKIRNINNDSAHGLQLFENSTIQGSWLVRGSAYSDSTRQNNIEFLAYHGDRSFWTSNYNRLHINSNGDIGIGTVSPSKKLDVAGDINYTGDLYKNGVLVSGGGGASAINDLTDGKTDASSIFLGEDSGANDDGGNWNVGIGYNSLKENVSGGNNTALGYGSLTSNTDGSNNTGVGFLALVHNDTGIRNVAVGSESLEANTGGSRNTASGYRSLFSNTTGADNVANGSESLRSNTTGNHNVSIGEFSMWANTTGSGNIAVGSSSLNSNTTGPNNTAVGMNALHDNQVGENNVAIGASSLYHNTANRNIAVGGWTLVNNTDGTNNVAIGDGAIYSGNANDNVAIGNWSMNQNTDGYANVSIGPWSMNQNNGGDENIAIGKSTLYSNKNGNSNVAIGNWASHKNNDGNENIAIGKSALWTNEHGSGNIAIGPWSSHKNIDASNNVSMGVAALYGNEHGSENTAIGVASLNRTEDGNGNVALGLASLYWNKHGDDNVAIGIRAGERSSDDSTNEDTNKDIFIGTNTRSGIVNSENETVVGYGAIGNGSNTVTIGNSDVIGNYLRQSVEINSPDGSTASLFLSEGDHYGFRLDYNGADDRLDLWSRKFSGNQEIRTTWLKNGNVGIGTTSPNAKLDVFGNSGSTYARVGDVDSNGRLKFGWESDDNFARITSWSSSAYKVLEMDASNIKLQVSSGGNVGIGIPRDQDPEEKLEVNGKIKAKEIITPGRGQTAWVGRMTSSNKDAGWGSYNDSGDSDQFDCTTHKDDGYCVALTDGPFISHFNNPVKANCYWYLRKNTTNRSPYALNKTTYIGAMKSISWNAHAGDQIGWYRSTNNAYDDDCSNGAQSTGFTLMSI